MKNYKKNFNWIFTSLFTLFIKPEKKIKNKPKSKRKRNREKRERNFRKREAKIFAKTSTCKFSKTS